MEKARVTKQTQRVSGVSFREEETFWTIEGKKEKFRHES